MLYPKQGRPPPMGTSAPTCDNDEGLWLAVADAVGKGPVPQPYPRSRLAPYEPPDDAATALTPPAWPSTKPCRSSPPKPGRPPSSERGTRTPAPCGASTADTPPRLLLRDGETEELAGVSTQPFG